MKVLVIGGGISSERDISLRSAQAVYDALYEGNNHEPSLYDWDGSEEWLQDNVAKFDVVFPALHGEGGEDGKIQTILERCKVAFVGTDSMHSRNCIDKSITKEILIQNNIRVPIGDIVNFQDYSKHRLYNVPHVLKPSIGGSSIDTFIYPDVTLRDDTKIKLAFDRHGELLIEEYVIGIEITAPVLGDSTLPIIEIIPPQNATFDYENKYNGKTEELCPAVNVSKELQIQAQQIAFNVHKIMGCRHLSRTDMIIQNGELIVLEINTMPGFTQQSLFPKSAKVYGINMTELVDTLVKLAYKDSVNGNK